MYRLQLIRYVVSKILLHDHQDWYHRTQIQTVQAEYSNDYAQSQSNTMGLQLNPHHGQN